MEFSIYDREYCCCEMTQPTSEEIGYSSYCYVPLSVSEDTDYHYDGNTGTLLSGGVPIKEYAMGGKMNQLELYGNYYKMFKGNGGMPEKVTVIDIEGDIVTFVSGHHSKEEFAERGNTVNEAIYNMCLVKNNCNSNKILTKITPKCQTADYLGRFPQIISDGNTCHSLRSMRQKHIISGVTADYRGLISVQLWLD